MPHVHACAFEGCHAAQSASAQEDAGQDRVGAGDSSHGDGHRATRRDVDRDVDPGALREVGADVGAPHTGAVVDADALPPAGALPVQDIEVERAAVGGREAEVEADLVGVVDGGGQTG